MKTPKKIWKDIAEKLRNKKGTTTAKGADMEMPADVEEVKVKIKKQTNTVDKATETDTKLCNKNSETGQPIFESSEKAQNDSVETTVEPTSVDRETNEQEPNPAEIELCFTIDEKDKPPTKTTQQRQAILASVVGAVLLVCGIVACILIMYAIAVVGGIVGLACVSFALYNIINPNTKLEKIKSVEQPVIQSPLNPT